MSFITATPISHSSFFSKNISAESGACASFFGMVRNHHEGRKVTKLYYECYAPMADRIIGLIRERAIRRWQLTEAGILHRVGMLEIGEVAIGVAVTSAHRAEAFRACEAIVEEIKHKAPIWKKEFYDNGASEWVHCAAPISARVL